VDRRDEAVSDAATALRELFERSRERNVGSSSYSRESLAICATPEGFYVDFWGRAYDEGLADVLATLGDPAVAAVLRSLTLRGPDEGSNGTREWDLEPLLASGATFPVLESVEIEQNAPGAHNRTIVSADGAYDEGGVLARLLQAAPALEELVSPSAPSPAFFAVDRHPLQVLGVHAGYDTRDFVLHLAGSTCFPKLRALEWGDYDERYMADYAERVTPFDHYRKLFASPALGGVTNLVLRNPSLSDDEIRGIPGSIGPNRQLQVIRVSATYVRRIPV
jgi:hypothetical protein